MWFVFYEVYAFAINLTKTIKLSDETAPEKEVPTKINLEGSLSIDNNIEVLRQQILQVAFFSGPGQTLNFTWIQGIKNDAKGQGSNTNNNTDLDKIG